VFGHGTFAGELIGNRWWMSSIVQAVYDTGIVGTVFLLWMYAAVTLSAWQAYRRWSDSVYGSTLLAFALGNALLFITSQFSSMLFVGFPWIFMGLTMGLVHADARHESG
jgi:hypothetical protein